MNEDTEAWIEKEFRECATLLDVAKKYAEVTTSIDCLAQNRFNEILVEMKEEERRMEGKNGRNRV